MSTVSGLNTKGEKGKSKYVALDINSLYKGKSLENPKATVQPKHGLQSLGKVGAGRRMPPPANLPSLKSENCGNNPNISLVPSGGQGWGSATKEKAKTEENNGSQQPSPQSQPVSSQSQTTQKTQNTPSTTTTPAVSKTWSSVTSSQEDGGQERNFLGQQSPFFPQEFPKLAGGDAPTEGNQKQSADSQYGPGPSLRPQTEGSWGRGTLQQQQQSTSQSTSIGGLQQSSGSGVNGQHSLSDTPFSSQSHLREQRPYSSTTRPLSNSMGSGSSIGSSNPTTPVSGSVSQGSGPGMGGPMGPGSTLHPPPPPHIRNILPSYIYQQRNYSSYPNFSGMPPPPARQPYPYPENRRSQPVRPLAEEEAYQRPAAIITEKALKGFDEILQNDTQDTWAASHGEIDYNAKLVFSDEEDNTSGQKKDKSYREDEKTGKLKGDKERDRKGDQPRNVSEREERARDSDWSRESRTEKKRDLDWSADRRDNNFNRENDERWKNWSQSSHGRPVSLGMDMQRHWPPSQQQPQQRVPFDYRGPPPQPPGAAYPPSRVRMGPGQVPLPPQHPSYTPPRPTRQSSRLSSIPDDDETWKHRKSEEMAETVERARQRRAEDEKRYEQSKQTAQEKAKALEKNDKEKKDVIDAEEHDRSRHSSESRDDKPPSRDGREREKDRERDRSQPAYQFQKVIPPRFQKQQQAEMMRQQTQQSMAMPPPPPQNVPPHYGRNQANQPTGGQTISHPIAPAGHGPPPASLPMNYDPRWTGHQGPPFMNQISGMPSSLAKINRTRSSSQGSGTDSYESDRCTPEQSSAYDRDARDHYCNWDSRPVWHASVNESYYDQKTENRVYDQRPDFKCAPEKETKDFDSHQCDADSSIDHRDRDFEPQDYRYRGRDSFKDRSDGKSSETREIKEKSAKSNSWATAKDYDDRMSEPFDAIPEPSKMKERQERPDRQDRWEKERPSRPDSRDSRASRESAKEEKYSERHDVSNMQSEKERKPISREEKREKQTLDWGDSPYPHESKRREWHHHPLPITPKQFESVAPPKKNLTTLKRSNAISGSQSSSDKKTEVLKDDNNKKTDSDSNVKREKEAKEEKNEKIKNENISKETEKHVEEKTDIVNDKNKMSGKESSKIIDDEQASETKTVIKDMDVKDKQFRDNKVEKDKNEQQSINRNDQGRDKRKDNRERGGMNSRMRGGNLPLSGNIQNMSGNSGRYDTSRGRGGSGRISNYGVNVGGGRNNFQGKSREYRRSRVERGPRFDKQKDKIKDEKKEKPSEESSGSEVEDNKLGRLRQKDEDSEVSVDEASASTTESAQAEKYQGTEEAHEDEKNLNILTNMVNKDDVLKNDKYQKDKRDNNNKREVKQYEMEKPKEDKGFAPRGEPSRRGRGGGGTISFRNSRGGPRYGPSNYGPPPSKAAFGSGKQEKTDEPKNDDSMKETAPRESKNIVHNTENSDLFIKDTNKPRSLERSQQRRSNRYEHLPPRLQKRQARRYDGFDHQIRGRGRGGRNSNYQGPNNQIMGKMNQGGKENLSDVANEEWETASESSDVAERRERRDDHKDDLKKKESKDKNVSSRKSFSSQRPMNEGCQNRRMGEPRRGNNDRNRHRESYTRENRHRDSNRGRSSGGNGGSNYNTGGGTTNNDRRLLNNTDSNMRQSNNANQHNARNPGRGNQPSSKPGAFPPKNEATATVYRVDEIKLQDPNSVQAALTDLTNRRNIKTDITTVSKVTKVEKDKSSVLDGYDLNNYASVVIIDDHPEVVEETTFLCGADDGFQEVMSKKRHKIMSDNEVKKAKKESHTRNKSGSRSRQSRLPPRFAKQRETNQINLAKSVMSATINSSWDIAPESVPIGSKQNGQFTGKDASPAPPPTVNAWEKPITHTLRTLSPSLNNQTSVTNINNSNANVVSSGTSTIMSDVQVLASSKSSSFDRSDQHDSGIDVSDQPASAASSQRSSPSNDSKIVTPQSQGKTNAGETCTDVELTASTNDHIGCVGNGLPKSKESTDDDKSLHLPVTFSSSKEPFGKGENSDIKLDFTFNSGLDHLTEDKNGNGGHLPNKQMNIGGAIEVPSRSVTVGVQSPISPSTDELNLKIASVKKVWENAPPMATVMEHPPSTAVADENSCPTSYGSYAGNSDPSSNNYNASVDPGSQGRKDTSDGTEISFRNNSPLQQAGVNSGLVAKTIEHNVCSVKAQVQAPQHNPITGPHCAGPMSPPLMGGLDAAMTGIRTIAGLTSSVQVAGISAIPSPPAVLFNSSQQIAQTGMYHQPLPMDSRQSQAAAVAAAAAMVQFSQSPHGYAPLGTYGLSQPPPSAQLSSAYGQQSLFVQPPSAHQGQDIYSSNQYRVQPPYPQSQHVSSNQVLGAQQNLANSHLLGSQLVQTRTAGGPSPAAPHLQSLHSLQAVQPGPQTSYFSTSAQAQTAAANFYHQPPATPGSPMQQPQYPSHQAYGSQSALNVLPQAAAAVTQNFRNFSSHTYKAASAVMNSSVPESTLSLRAAARSPTADTAVSRNAYSVTTGTATTAMNSTSIMTSAQMTSPGAVGKMTQSQSNTSVSSRLNATGNKASQYSLPQSQQHYFPFGQQKFGHVQSNTVRPSQVMFPGVVRNTHQTQHPNIATSAATIHYPTPIQRPGVHTGVTQQIQVPKIGNRTQTNVMVPGGKLTTAEQAKLRAEAVQQTHIFFTQSKTGKPDDAMAGILAQEKNIASANSSKMSLTNSVSDENQEGKEMSMPNADSNANKEKQDSIDRSAVEK